MSEINAGPIDELFRAAVADGAYPGVVAVATDRDGIIYEGGFGGLQVGGDDVTVDTTFRIASMTKALTSTAIMQLVERGRLGLDDAVADHVPAFGELQVLEGWDGDVPRLRTPSRSATIRELLTHTAGCGYFFSNADLERWHDITGVPNVVAFDPAGLTAPLIADPGTMWEYGTNTDWAGRVVEEVSGQRLDAYLAEHVFTPLGMARTTFAPDDEQLAQTMTIHARTPDGGLVPTELEWPRDPEHIFGGQHAYSTAGDYARFTRAMLRGGELDGERILAEATVEQMFSPQIGEIALPEIIRSARPDLSNDIPAMPVPSTWGLGFQLVLADLPGMRRAGTGSWAGLANCYYWIDRAAGVSGIVLTQVLPFFDEPIVTASLQFEAAVYAQVGAAAAA